jgi:acyl carrier protein
MDETKQQVRQFLSELLPNGKMASLRDDSALRTSGLLDSMSLLRLVAYVEETFGIEVEAYEAGVENFDRIDDIAAFVERKRPQEHESNFSHLSVNRIDR